MSTDRQEQYMNEMYEEADWEEVRAIVDKNAIRWSGALELLADGKCPNGECPSCAAEQTRND